MKKSFTTACSKDKLKDIRSFIKDCIKPLELKDIEKSQIVLAIDEACANAIIHGNDCDEDKRINLDVSVTKKELKVEIYDIGPKDFDQLQYTRKRIKEIIQNKQKGGMGLKLMHAIMDDVFYYSKNDAYICSLTKKLK